ncbi:hypothetical protein [Paraliomyxa miuraensis]|uniref:hypothetical protein n=1 Tax=Paraliomyxa miuraensis TaxID=376150 RepID=UPI00224EBECC|nr:hypothetical protein [Paraliomyxa miuraensis]MCX4240639.1 hypothetical protein [Paraliomyxa miuraensis]
MALLRRSIAGAGAWLGLGLLAGAALASCTTEPADGAAECACFSGPSDELEVTCEVDNCGTVSDPSDCTMTPDGMVPEGCYEDAEASNTQVVSCVLDLLASGQPGRFRYRSATFLGTITKTRNYLANGEGTIVKWDENFNDAVVSFSAVEAREVPDAGALEPCMEIADPFEQWECIEGAITGAPVVMECAPAAEGMPGQ